jgi:hypothetical protein
MGDSDSTSSLATAAQSRAEGYKHAAKVWSLCLVPRAVLCHPVPSPNRSIRNKQRRVGTRRHRVFDRWWCGGVDGRA